MSSTLRQDMSVNHRRRHLSIALHQILLMQGLNASQVILEKGGECGRKSRETILLPFTQRYSQLLHDITF